VGHQEDEADPWHIGGAAKELRDGVGASGREEEGAQAIPQVEEADEIENGDAGVMLNVYASPRRIGGSSDVPQREKVLVGRSRIGDSFEKTGEGIG
jgi:hypothetical protein